MNTFGSILSLRRLLATAACLALAGAATAGHDGGVAGGYLRFGASARSLGLGNAVGGLVDDAATSYWNPAGYASLRTMELTAMGASLGMDTHYGFMTLGLPTERWGTFALSGTYTSSGEFESATLYEDLDATFSQRESIHSFAWARPLGRLSLGLAVKNVRQSIAGASGSGTGLDLGAHYRPHQALGLGVSVQNALAPKLTLIEAEEELPHSLRAGIALNFFQGRLEMTADMVRTRWMDPGYHFGLETWPHRQVALRAGYDGEKEQWATGAGFRWENWQFDYAYVNTDLGSQNVVSATLRFGVPYGVKLDRDRALFSPSGSDRTVTFGIRTAVRGEIDRWQVVIRDSEDREVRRLEDSGAPPAEVTWNGEDTDGRLVDDGVYTARVQIVDALGQVWDYQSQVEVMGFRERTRTPIRLEIGGSAAGAAEGSLR
ncbi:MAG: PorV/PorQ family protein [Candidatus Krumholzibacteria bacterium]|nr:PorV/PorQ family protein [Candidatus Krumholzibacteria bacterium]